MPYRFLLVPALACAAAAQTSPDSFQAVDLNTALAPAALVQQVASKRVVFVGETHDRYDHHLNQLEIVRGLYAQDPKLSIGVEYFEQRFQSHVDDYIEGRIDEQEFLRTTDYFEEWGYDYRLYQPIFRFAREKKISVRALNVPTSVVSAVSKSGLGGLTPQQRDGLPPDYGPADPDYRTRLRGVFEQHGSPKPEAFDHFVEAQLTWDESMSAAAAAYLIANPDRRMVILAGSGHIEFGSGIPQRLARRTHATYATVINVGNNDEFGPHMADYLLFSKAQELPAAAVLGVNTDDKSGECKIRSLTPGGAAEKAGLKKGDVLTEIDGQPVKRTADIRLALWNKKPGDTVQLQVRHGHNDHRISATLATPPKPH